MHNNRILIDATLPEIKRAFPEPFQVTTYSSHEELKKLLPHYRLLVCRSTLKIDTELLENSHLLAIATASSGTDHIDKKLLHAKNITLVDAKGCNANSVADYVLATIAALNNQTISTGKKAGIIGFGKVGSVVAPRLKHLGFEVLLYDPPLAQKNPQFKSCHLDALLSCNLICIHAELHNTFPFPSHNLIQKNFLEQLNPQTVIINAARGGIVNEDDVLQNQNSLYYCTDVYHNEPNINPKLVEFATLCTPHIAGHSIEGKINAVYLVSQQLHQLLNLPKPYFDDFSKKIPFNLKGNWQKDLLSLYDPTSETQKLKAAKGSKEVFLSLRTAHNFRHDIFF